MEVKKSAELSEDNLEQVGGGVMSFDPGSARQQRYIFNKKEVENNEFLQARGIKANKTYARGELNDKLGTTYGTGSGMNEFLENTLGLDVQTS